MSDTIPKAREYLVNHKQPLIVTGAQGRLGRLLRLAGGSEDFAGFSTVWTARQAGPALRGWDMLRGDAPDLPKGGILLHLAAAVPGRGQSGDLLDNLALARAVLAADHRRPFAHVVFVSTVAVYAPEAGVIRETKAPAPQNDYGRAKHLAENLLAEGLGSRLTILRLANLAGADALLGGAVRQVVLDPVAGQPGGPLRSYIGPQMLAQVLGRLLGQMASNIPLPPILNLAQPGAVAMADLLTVSGKIWRFGPVRAETVAKVEVDVALLTSLFPLPTASASGLWADLSGLNGVWP